MENSGSAGVLITAVLESAGYLAQSNILVWFDKFWLYGGALLYTCAVAGGILSIAIFGSYRWGRYLLIAPALFWFLTNTTEELNFVTWKLGGSKAVKVDPIVGRALVDRDEELRKELLKANPGQANAGEEFNKKVRVSWFFSKTAKISSALVNGIVDQILYNEHNDDMLLATRATILQFFLNAKPEDNETYQLFIETYLGKCLPYTEKQLIYANARYSDARLVNGPFARIDELEKGIADGQTTDRDTQIYAQLKARFGELKKERDQLDREIKALGQAKHELGPHMRDFFSRMAANNAKNLVDPDIVYKDQNLGALRLTCEQMSHVVVHKFVEDADHVLAKALTAKWQESSRPNADIKALREELCQKIARKLHQSRSEKDVQIDPNTGKGRDCNLSETIAIFMFRSVLLEQNYSRNIDVAKNERIKFSKEGHAYIDPDSIGKKAGKIKVYTQKEAEQLMTGLGNNKYIDKDGLVVVRNEKGELRRLLEVKVEAPYNSFYGDAQHYASRELQQNVFSGATKIPYYQGVLLYFVAAVFPFLALLVLLPGHAEAFLYVPLTWFWIKSWDIGYACVIVMDKILWNLLPSTEIKDKIFTGGAADPVNPYSVLPRAIQSAMATTDPTYDIHVNFNFTAMVLYAIPAITGYAILKSKKSILSSFTSGPQDAGRDAGQIGGTSFGMSILNQNVQVLGDFENYAAFAQGSPDSSADRVGEGYKYGGMALGGSAMGSVGDALHKSKNATEDKPYSRQQKREDWISGVSNAYIEGSKKYRSIVSKEFDYDVARAYAFDETFGTMGLAAQNRRVIAAMVDGARRFELEKMDFAARIIGAKHEIYMEKFWTEAELVVSGANLATEVFVPKKWGQAKSDIGLVYGTGVAGANAYDAFYSEDSNIDVHRTNNAEEAIGSFFQAKPWVPFTGKDR